MNFEDTTESLISKSGACPRSSEALNMRSCLRDTKSLVLVQGEQAVESSWALF